MVYGHESTLKVKLQRNRFISTNKVLKKRNEKVLKNLGHILFSSNELKNFCHDTLRIT